MRSHIVLHQVDLLRREEVDLVENYVSRRVKK